MYTSINKKKYNVDAYLGSSDLGLFGVMNIYF